jgi:hypothetical protein
VNGSADEKRRGTRRLMIRCIANIVCDDYVHCCTVFLEQGLIRFGDGGVIVIADDHI